MKLANPRPQNLTSIDDLDRNIVDLCSQINAAADFERTNRLVVLVFDVYFSTHQLAKPRASARPG